MDTVMLKMNEHHIEKEKDNANKSINNIAGFSTIITKTINQYVFEKIPKY